MVSLGNIISKAAVREGYEVIASEATGSMQRGGSVIVYIRMGQDSMASEVGRIWSGTEAFFNDALPCALNTHLLIGLEPLESLKCALKYMGPEGLAITSIRPVLPLSVSQGDASYMEIGEILRNLRRICKEVIDLDAVALAEESAGTAQAANMVLLGATWRYGLLPFSRGVVEGAMADCLPERWLDKNLLAFTAGARAIGEEVVR